jgi:predicted RNA-binding protein with PUA-like domain
MAHYLVKTEPSTYSFEDLTRQKRATWDGVANPVALRNLRAMRPGDEVLVYHTGDVKAAVGLARVVSEPYPDPKAKDEKLTVVDLEVVRALPHPVTLASVKADPAFADFALVRQGRLSVMEVPPDLWKRLLHLASSPAAAPAAKPRKK